MGRVQTNSVTLAVAAEATPGVLPGSPQWNLLEPNTIGAYGATITTVPRNPISKLRQRRKGAVTDLDSKVEFEHDLTMDVLRQFIEGFCFASRTGLLAGPLHLTSAADALAATSSTSGYTYTSITGSAVPAGRLVYARGFTTSANNGLKVVLASSTDAKILVAGLTTEAPTAAQNAQVDVVGVRGASGDITAAAGHILSTVLDFTTLGLVVGQFIWVGGATSGLQFATAADSGFARITSIAAHDLGIDKTDAAFTTDNGSGKTIDLIFGQFVRNVSVDSSSYLERTFQFEVTYPNIANPSGDKYEYAKGNYCNQLTFDLPLTDKAKITPGFLGLTTDKLTGTRKTNASTPVLPVATGALSTSTDIVRLRVISAINGTLGSCFKKVTLTLNNNDTAEKCLGVLGASYVNSGIFEVDVDAEALFTDSFMTDAIRDNESLTMDFALHNADGGVCVDIPSLTMGGGARQFPLNQSVHITEKAAAFVDPTLGTSVSFSLFPYLPF